VPELVGIFPETAELKRSLQALLDESIRIHPQDRDGA
jgi:hypothetical protein